MTYDLPLPLPTPHRTVLTVIVDYSEPGAIYLELEPYETSYVVQQSLFIHNIIKRWVNLYAKLILVTLHVCCLKSSIYNLEIYDIPAWPITIAAI